MPSDICVQSRLTDMHNYRKKHYNDTSDLKIITEFISDWIQIFLPKGYKNPQNNRGNPMWKLIEKENKTCKNNATN